MSSDSFPELQTLRFGLPPMVEYAIQRVGLCLEVCSHLPVDELTEIRDGKKRLCVMDADDLK